MGTALKNRRDPGFGQNADFGMGKVVSYRPYRGRRHDGVPDPIGGSNQQFADIFRVYRCDAHGKLKNPGPGVVRPGFPALVQPEPLFGMLI